MIRPVCLSLGLLGDAEELGLLLLGLEATMAELGRGVNELQGHLLQSRASGAGNQRLAQGQDTALGARDATLEHEPVLSDNAVVGETTHGGDRLLGQVVLSGSVLGVLLQALANLVDLLVDLGAVMETTLTGTGHLELHAGRMPRTDTG